MSPLPCSPVSNSTASESLSLQEDESDVSLTTPRPGPADPAQRTSERLSTPSLPATSLNAVTGIDDSDKRSASLFSKRREESSSSAVSPLSDRSTSPTTITGLSTAQPERQRSITFVRQGSSPKRKSIYGNTSPMSRLSPAISPHADARISLVAEDDILATESSADENTAIFRRENLAGRQYGGVIDEVGSGAAGSSRRRTAKGKEAQKSSNAAGDQSSSDAKAGGAESWWKKMVEKYGSVELENKGSVARDHLALERTFLAWLRTSLSFASIGIAVTQLFRLNTSLSNDSGSGDSGSSNDPAANLRQVGKPLGATFLGISILILLLGFHRYFESQHYVIRGKFPASRVTIVLVSFVAGGLIVASLAVVLAVAPTAFES